MQKLYCYVDETGQDTKGAFFLVALVLINKERDDLRKLLMRAEDDSRKGKLKWKKATSKQKSAYITAVLNAAAFQGKLFYGQFSHTTAYLTCIKVSIFIDGLGKHERRIVAVQLRRRGIHVEKVRGVRDEADEFIRLADALAGFLRDYLEGESYARALYQPTTLHQLISKL